MSWIIRNYLGRAEVKVRSFLWTSDNIGMGGEYRSDRGGDSFDITVEGVSGYFWEAIMNPALIRTNVSSSRETCVTLRDGGVDRGKMTVRITVTDNHGRNEHSEVEVDMAR